MVNDDLECFKRRIELFQSTYFFFHLIGYIFWIAFFDDGDGITVVLDQRHKAAFCLQYFLFFRSGNVSSRQCASNFSSYNSHILHDVRQDIHHDVHHEISFQLRIEDEVGFIADFPHDLV